MEKSQRLSDAYPGDHLTIASLKEIENLYVMDDLVVGADISLSAKAALLVIERDTTLDDASLSEINAALAELAGT